MKILFPFLALITVTLSPLLSEDGYRKNSEQIAFESEINSSMDKIKEKALTSGLTMDDVYLSIPENVNNMELKAYLAAYAEKFKDLVQQVWDEYGLIKRDPSFYEDVPHLKEIDEVYNEAHIKYQKEWRELLNAKAEFRYTGGGTGAGQRYSYTIIEECIDRIIELKPSLK